jgi:hypothetical protein
VHGEGQESQMGDSPTVRGGGATPRRRRPSSPGSTVLTPPTGVPSVPDAEAFVPAQRAPDDHRPSEPPPTVVEPCVCGHAREAHEHFRRGHDCGACGATGCATFRPVGGPTRRIMRHLGLSD